MRAKCQSLFERSALLLGNEEHRDESDYIDAGNSADGEAEAMAGSDHRNNHRSGSAADETASVVQRGLRGTTHFGREQLGDQGAVAADHAVGEHAHKEAADEQRRGIGELAIDDDHCSSANLERPERRTTSSLVGQEAEGRNADHHAQNRHGGPQTRRRKALGEVKRLAGSIVDDLSEPETPDRASQLDSIVGAFALIGIEVCVKGSLPEDDDAASVFVNIVREAATNAAKHAQAKHVDVNISRIGNVTLLRVVNDGMPAPANLRMGCGIPGMRRAAEAIGGTFDVSSNDPFTIEVHLERPESAHAPSVRAVYEKELS